MDEFSIKLLHYFLLFPTSHVEKLCMVLCSKMSFNNSSWMKLVIYVTQFTKTLKILKLSAQSSFFFNYFIEDVFEIWWHFSSIPLAKIWNIQLLNYYPWKMPGAYCKLLRPWQFWLQWSANPWNFEASSTDLQTKNELIPMILGPTWKSFSPKDYLLNPYWILMSKISFVGG